MEYGHKSVMLAEVLQQLISNTRGIFVDCTLGGAGHTKAILETIGVKGFVLGIDKDITAINAAKEKLKDFSQQFYLIHGDFRYLDELLNSKVEKVDGFLFDLGLSSIQLDAAERGFSYKNEGSLDMRMDLDQKLTAYDVVNSYEKKDLSSLIYQYGEEKWASRIAGFIVKTRERNPIKSTTDLVDVIKAAIPASARRTGPHPAKRTFQAIRIEVNEELKAIESALWQTVKWLKVGGRIVVISYHSLEDRITKQIFKKLAQGFMCEAGFKNCKGFEKPFVEIITKRPMRPKEEEIIENPRARSAKLRVAEKT